MSKPSGTATTRSTAGPDFHFEDVVGAWLLQKTMSSEPDRRPNMTPVHTVDGGHGKCRTKS